MDSLDKKIMKKTLTEINKIYQKSGRLAMYDKTTDIENEWLSNPDFRSYYKKIQLDAIYKNEKFSTTKKKKTCKKKLNGYTTGSATKAQ